jgi:cytochrome c biogenesis factor
MNSSKALAILALFLGLVGAVANGFAASRQLRGTRLNLTKEAADSAKRWAVVGWFFVVLGVIAGIVATFSG